jgi:hypothetical protein
MVCVVFGFVFRRQRVSLEVAITPAGNSVTAMGARYVFGFFGTRHRTAYFIYVEGAAASRAGAAFNVHISPFFLLFSAAGWRSERAAPLLLEIWGRLASFASLRSCIPVLFSRNDLLIGPLPKDLKRQCNGFKLNCTGIHSRVVTT